MERGRRWRECKDLNGWIVNLLLEAQRLFTRFFRENKASPI